jgi:hypothetical protein
MFSEIRKGRTVLICLSVLIAGLAFNVIGVRTAAQAPRNQAPFQGDPNDLDRVDETRGPVDLNLMDPALVGAIDIHEHLGPAPRFTSQRMSIDVFDEAKLAKRRGMRGFVFKSHLDASAAAAAYLVRAHVEPTLEVFGRMPLNFAVGGINVAAVDEFTQIQGGWGRIVEMPTMDGRCPCGPDKVGDLPPGSQGNQLEYNRRWAFLMPPDAPKYVAISKDHELLPEVKRLIGLMAKMVTVDSSGRLALGTGHSSGEEDLLLAREGRKAGLQVTCPHCIGDLNPAQMDEYVKMGGFMEMRHNSLSADVVKKIGAEHIIASTDCGFMNNPFPPDCLAIMAQKLRAQGITERQIDIMFKENPAKLLGLPPWRRPDEPSTASVGRN